MPLPPSSHPGRARTRGRFDVRAVARGEKSFSHPVIGQPLLNALGLHLLRLKASDLSMSVRRRGGPAVRSQRLRGAHSALERDGVAVCHAFLPDAEFQALAAEARSRLSALAQRHPLPNDADTGFGPKRPFQGGFDRFDGGSLNRFLAIDPQTSPRCAAWMRSERVQSLCRLCTTLQPATHKFWIQQLVHGTGSAPYDIQKELHRDTFHAAYKLWFYLDDVGPEQGPFEYVVGSQRMTRQRLAWEYARSVRARTLDPESANGSFRVGEQELTELGLPSPRAFPVPANTLLIADVRGFHRRGHGSPGAVRNAIHVNLRPHPFG